MSQIRARRPVAEELAAYILARKALTDRQRVLPWMWISHGGEIKGVLVPRDGAVPPLRVTVESMRLFGGSS